MELKREAEKPQGFFVDLVGDGSCINVSGLSFGALLRAIMDISAHAI
jgi:hypothetical protein